MMEEKIFFTGGDALVYLTETMHEKYCTNIIQGTVLIKKPIVQCQLWLVWGLLF